MIQAIFFKNKKNITGFEIKNHGTDIVCSAVSILSLNTVIFFLFLKNIACIILKTSSY